jgi:hypothetical protein
MHKPITICAVAGICSMLALLPAATTALAQAGSTGGTIGKQDKSVSGGEERTVPKRSARPTGSRETHSTACGKLAGVWSWFVNGDVFIKADGTFAQPQARLTGTWLCDGTNVVMLWSHGATDRLTLSPDGMHLSGTNGLMTVTGDRK